MEQVIRSVSIVDFVKFPKKNQDFAVGLQSLSFSFHIFIIEPDLLRL